MGFVTAKTFPLDPETGEFQSGPAEAAYVAGKRMHLSREDIRCIIQAYQCAMDECDRRYEQFKREREQGQGSDNGSPLDFGSRDEGPTPSPCAPRPT